MGKVKYTFSRNIIRDEEKRLDYVTSSNSKRIAHLILDEFKNGIHSFNLIGSYGTGKSSFLLAFQKTFSKANNENFFDLEGSDFRFLKTINIVGEYNSIINYFERHFSIENNSKGNQKIFDSLYQEYESVKKNDGILLICIDEFGKFLEYASQNHPEREMYFIQQLTEFVNDTDRNIILLTTVHQAIDSYAFQLTDSQRTEWTKVKGRLKEIAFNEPVEHLLLLASEHLSSKCESQPNVTKYLNKLVEINNKNHCFKIPSPYLRSIVQKLFPLDLFSAVALTYSLQRYGQNERSLFSFLQSADHLGLDIIENKQLYDLPKVYDYLLANLYSTIVSKVNPDYSSWALIKDSIEKVEAKADDNQLFALDLVKSIGLLNLFSSKGASINDELLLDYFSIKYNKREITETIRLLIKLKIIRFNNFNNSYKLYGGTDVDIEQEILNVSSRVNTEIDIVSKLKADFDFPVIVAKEFLHKTGTPRLFQFKISESPINDTPTNEIDGFINLVFNENLNGKTLNALSKESDEAILFGLYKNTGTIRKTLLDIAKTEKVLSEIDTDDNFAIKELQNIKKSQRALLSHYVQDSLFSEKIEWFFKGEKVAFKNKQELNKCLTDICFQVYPYTPRINMELINRHKASGSINSARKLFFKRLVKSWDQEDLGYPNESS